MKNYILSTMLFLFLKPAIVYIGAHHINQLTTVIFRPWIALVTVPQHVTILWFQRELGRTQKLVVRRTTSSARAKELLFETVVTIDNTILSTLYCKRVVYIPVRHQVKFVVKLALRDFVRVSISSYRRLSDNRSRIFKVFIVRTTTCQLIVYYDVAIETKYLRNGLHKSFQVKCCFWQQMDNRWTHICRAWC